MGFITQHPVLVVSLVKIAVLLFIVMTALAYLTWLERKVIAHIQSRWGPYRVGPHGLLQPLADGLKFMFKEDVTPPVSDRLVYMLAPFLALALSLTAIALIPFGPPSVQLLGQPFRRLKREHRPAVSFLHHFDRRVWRRAGGLVFEQQVFAAGRSAQLGADDQLRGFAHDFRGRRTTRWPARSASTTSSSGQGGYWWHFIPKWNI